MCISKPKISIIVPVYNVSKYLRHCLDSILQQLSESVEIIIVDDGSTDGSSEILQEYKSKNQHIVLIRQDNAGLSAARNTGMKSAAGEYLWFIDSDDLIYDGSIKFLLNYIEKNPGLDLIRFGFLLFEDGSNQEMEMHRYKAEAKVSSLDYFRVHEMMYQAWAGLYRADFLVENQIMFHTGQIYEDIPFNLQAYSADAAMAVLPNVLYKYRSRAGSLLRSPVTEEKINSINYIIVVCDEIIAKNRTTSVTLAVRKKFDYIYLFLDHLHSFPDFDTKEKWEKFCTVNRKVPLLRSDSKGLVYNKLILRFFPKRFFKKRMRTLIKKRR